MRSECVKGDRPSKRHSRANSGSAIEDSVDRYAVQYAKHLDQVVVVRVRRGCGSRGQIQLGENIAQVAGDGLLADLELARDSAVGHAGGDQFQNLHFPLGKGTGGMEPALGQESVYTREVNHGSQVFEMSGAPAVSSSSASSSSPSARHASAMRSRTRAASYGACSSHQRFQDRLSSVNAPRASPSARSTAPVAREDRARQEWSVLTRGNLCQFIGGRARCCDILGGQSDLDICFQNPGSRSGFLNVLASATDRRVRRFNPALRQP